MNVREFAMTSDRIRLGDAVPTTKVPDIVVYGLLADFEPGPLAWGIEEVFQAVELPESIPVLLAVRRELGGRIDMSRPTAATILGPPPPSARLAKGAVNSAWRSWNAEQKALWRRCREVAESRLETACPDPEERTGWAAWWGVDVVRAASASCYLGPP